MKSVSAHEPHLSRVSSKNGVQTNISQASSDAHTVSLQQATDLFHFWTVWGYRWPLMTRYMSHTVNPWSGYCSCLSWGFHVCLPLSNVLRLYLNPSHNVKVQTQVPTEIFKQLRCIYNAKCRIDLLVLGHGVHPHMLYFDPVIVPITLFGLFSNLANATPVIMLLIGVVSKGASVLWAKLRLFWMLASNVLVWI